MKNLSLFALFFLLATQVVHAADDRPELVKISTVDGKMVWVTKEVLKETYFATFGAPKNRLSAAEKARAGVQIRQDAYKWAYSQSGMNASTDASRTFAEEMADRENPTDSFLAFKAAYEYAYSSSGLNKSPEDCRKLADRISRLETPLEMLAVFKTAYHNAYSSQGMNLSPERSLQYALKAIGLE